MSVEGLLSVIVLLLLYIAIMMSWAEKQRKAISDTLVRELRKAQKVQPQLEQPGDGLLDCYQHWQDHRDELLK